MNYYKKYIDLIKSRKILNRNKKTGIYEKHHIIPRCLGGTNDKENLVLLTPKEHYIAHLLLTQMYEGKIKAKMCYALLMMCRNNPKQNRIVSAKQYDFVKKLVTENCSGTNGSFFGKHLSDKHRKDISERMKGDNNPSRKYGVWNTGLKLKPHTLETRNKLSILNKGQIRTNETKLKMSLSSKGKPKSEEHKKRLSEVNLGKILSDETKNKMSLARKGIKQKQIKCPHCGKVGGTTMYRWHFDNCNYLKYSSS